MACEYCEKEKPIISDYSVKVVISDFTNELVAAYYDQIWDAKAARINYCPMCGRKLNG